MRWAARFLATATVLGAAAAVCAADEADRRLENLSLEELMQVRVRSPALASQPVAEAPSVVSVITAEQIRALGLRTLADALELMPGVSVLTSPLGSQRLAVRGRANSNEVLVTLDGERLNDFYDGSFPLDFPLENIERIELIRGPGSALYGTNAFAGVVSMYSRNATEALAGLGVESTFDHSAGVGLRTFAKGERRFGRWTLALFGSYRESTGPKVLITRDGADPVFSLVPAETDEPLRIGVAQLLVKRAGLLVSRDALSLWAAFIYRRRGSYFGPSGDLAPGGDLERQELHARLAYDAPLAAGVSATHRFGFDRRALDDRIQDEPPGYYHEVDGNFTREPDEVFPDGKIVAFAFTTYRVGEQSQLEWKLPKPRVIAGNDLIVGATLEYTWLPAFIYGQNFCCGAAYTYAGPILANYDQLPLVQLHKDRLFAAAFVHDVFQPWRWMWLTVGLRLDWYSDFGVTWNPRAALVVRALPQLTFKLLYGRAFRAPSFRELYDQTGVSETAGGLLIQGQSNLLPEITNTVETGVEATPARFVTLRANAFYMRTSDDIDVDATFTLSGARQVNFPGTQIWGGEAEAQLHLDENNYLSANLSYFDAMELDVGLPGYQSDAERRFIDPELHDLPRLRINAIAAARPLARVHAAVLRPIELGLAYSYVAGLANNDRFTFEALAIFRQPPFHELSANLVWPFLRGHLELDVTVQLAFNRTIAVALENGWYDVPTSGANLFVGLRAHD